MRCSITYLIFYRFKKCFRSELKDENLVNDQPLTKSSDGYVLDMRNFQYQAKKMFILFQRLV